MTLKHLLAALGAILVLAIPEVSLAAIVISPATIPDPAVGEPYSQTFTASGGTSPYLFTASGLPAGLTLVGDTISGTPTASGAFVINVSVSDFSTTTLCIPGPCPPNFPITIISPQTGSASYNVNVAAAVPTLSEWAMIIFVLLLAGGAMFELNRRRVAG